MSYTIAAVATEVDVDEKALTEFIRSYRVDLEQDQDPDDFFPPSGADSYTVTEAGRTEIRRIFHDTPEELNENGVFDVVGATKDRRLAQEAWDRATAEWHETICAAVRAGVQRMAIAQAAGISRERLYQIIHTHCEPNLVGRRTDGKVGHAT